MLGKLWNRLAGKGQAQTNPYWATRESLLDMLGSCPTCHLPLHGHRWATIAEAGTKSDYRRSMELVKTAQWAELGTIHSFIGTENAIIVIVIPCTSQSGAVVSYVDFAELWFTNESSAPIPLYQDDWLRLIRELPCLEWHEFYPTQHPTP